MEMHLVTNEVASMKIWWCSGDKGTMSESHAWARFLDHVELFYPG